MIRRSRHHWVEVPCCCIVGGVPEFVRHAAPDKGKVGSQRKLKKVIPPPHIQYLLALCNDRADAGGCEKSSQTCPACSDSLGKSPLRNQNTLQLIFFDISIHPLCYLRIQAHMRCDQDLDLAVGQQFAYAPSRHTRIIADDGKVFYVLSDQSINQDLRCSTGHKSTYHDACAILDDGHGLIRSLDFVNHLFIFLSLKKCNVF